MELTPGVQSGSLLLGPSVGICDEQIAINAPQLTSPGNSSFSCPSDSHQAQHNTPHRSLFPNYHHQQQQRLEPPPPLLLPPPTNSPGAYRPDSNRGRKRSTREAPSHKAALNREAQRALRERKANYIKNLEAQITELAAANGVLALKQQVSATLLSPPGSTGAQLDASLGSTPQNELSFQIDTLRQRNRDLELQLADAVAASERRSPQSRHCITCNSERMKTMICIDQIKVLEGQVGSLQRQIAALLAQLPDDQNSLTPRLHASTSASSISNKDSTSSGEYIFDLNSMLANEEVLLDFMQTPIDWHSEPAPICADAPQKGNYSKPRASSSSPLSPLTMTSTIGSIGNIATSAAAKTSEQLFGPMEVETFRIVLKQVPSLRRRPELVDSLFDLLLAQTKITNVRDARRVLVQINRACFNVLEAIDRADKSKYNELFAIFHERNAKHEIHFSELCAPPEEIKQQFAQRILKPLPPHVFQFRNTLKCIPSLGTGEAGTMVDQFCNLWVYKEDIRGEGFYYYNYCLYELERLCTNVEDRSKFWEAYDGMWASDHANVEVLLGKIEHE
ncbi:hypothetical protein HDU83_001957 [Entophlyctis luteolus]|nr:hypothetical protein HDU83_001957 [Entophlyctis luteolus]